MLAKSISALAIFAFGAQASAEDARQPYKPQVMKMSVRDLFGVGRRQDTSGYQPSQSVCGSGSTCAEACGTGYETCASSDDTVHCYDPTAKQICCPDASGNSCDSGYYCTADHSAGTWCCPDSMDLTACAAAYSVTGGLVSEVSSITSSSSTSTSSLVITTAPANSTTSSAPSSTIVSAPLNGTSTDFETATLTTSCTSTGVAASASYIGSNTTSISYVATGKPSASKSASASGSSASTVTTSQGNRATGPFAALVLVAAAFVALL